MVLTDLKKGQEAIITEFIGLSDSFSRRLYDMGISIGSTARLQDVLSFGRLYLISVDDVDFCLRYSEAAKIGVSLA
ncbi:MAG: ferrous iron transport protein A [Turicibacter sp.]|nr:ferrous iron transport protein A [Turicibacter sp.]